VSESFGFVRPTVLIVGVWTRFDYYRLKFGQLTNPIDSLLFHTAAS
jgi:hypothetical protein